MKTRISLVVFSLEGQRYALELGQVQRIVPAVEITPLPNLPDVVVGIIDLAGSIVPVVSLRRRLGFPEQEVHPADQLVIAQTAHRVVAFVVDESFGVIERPAAEIADLAGVIAGLEQIHGVARTDDGLVWIHDLEKFLSLDEARTLDEALRQHSSHEARC